MKLLIVRGVSGSGKSTYAKAKLVDETAMNWFWCEADQFFYQNKEKTYQFDPKFLASAHRWCRNNVENLLVMGHNVIVSNTFTRLWEYQPYLDLAKSCGAEVEIHVCKGEYKSIHAPDDVVLRQKANWEE